MTDPHQTQLQTKGKFGLSFWTCLVVLCFFVITSLVLASKVLVPLTLALIMFVLVTAIVDRVAALRVFGAQIPRWMAQVIALVLVLVGFIGAFSVLSNQANAVAAAFPGYEERFDLIIARLAEMIGDDNLASAQEALFDFDLAQFAKGVIASAGAFLSGFTLVLLYVPFMLAERGPMRDKIVLATPDPALRDTIRQITDSMSLSLQRYIGIKTMVSIVTGVLSYAIMKPVGLENAETWAILTFALNFIPTIGSIVAVALPSLIALTQFETFTPLLIILAGCGSIQFIIGNILEPTLTGRTLNLSPLMVLLALTFWTAIWGIPGALLSVPITVCGLIILSHIPATKPIAILISGDGKLLDLEELKNQK